MTTHQPLRVLYKQVDDCKIFCDVYSPKAANHEEEDRPVLINIHGGAFCLGHARMVNMDQVEDFVERGWIVVVPEHRLCPQVDILHGPMQDCRDLLDWIHDGKLDLTLKDAGISLRANLSRVLSFGTSSGGCLALALGFGVKKPVFAVVDFYGATHFSDPFWTSPLANMKAPPVPESFIQKVYDESPVATRGDVSLEGQAPVAGKPPPLTPRAAFTFTHIANGTLMDVCVPNKELAKVDAIKNIDHDFPPTCIVHGTADTKVPLHLSKALEATMRSKGVECKLIEVPGEEHTFAGQMVKGSDTWNIQRESFNWLESLVASS